MKDNGEDAIVRAEKSSNTEDQSTANMYSRA